METDGQVFVELEHFWWNRQGDMMGRQQQRKSHREIGRGIRPSLDIISCYTLKVLPALDVKVKSHNKKLLINNNITVPTHINSLSTKSAKSYNKC